MLVTYEECCEVIRQFKAAHPLVAMQAGVHGIQVTVKEDRPRIEILVSNEFNINTGDTALIDVGKFSYHFAGELKALAVEVVKSPIARAKQSDAISEATDFVSKGEESRRSDISLLAAGVAQPGDPAWGQGLNGYGTLGWNVYLNGVLVGLSNWHVFCARGNETVLHTPVYIGGQPLAELYDFERVGPSGNTWDFALAKYLDPSTATGSMRACESGTISPYPTRLTPIGSLKFHDGAAYYKVGSRSPICRRGSILGVGQRQIQYENGILRWFDNQLIFTKMSDPGDSGCLIVREHDQTATGLNFAGSDRETIANPIFLLDWQHIGFVRFNDRQDIPMFSSSRARPVMSALGARGATDVAATLPNYGPNRADFVQNVPPMSAGKLFLGVARLTYYYGTHPSWTIAPSPPIRPGVTVDTIMFSDKYTPPVSGVYYGGGEVLGYQDFLCFG